MARQSVLSWSVQEAFIKAYRSFDGRLNDTYVWIEEAIVEAKKTFETPEIQLIPKTPSAKRCLRKRTERDPATHGRSLRSTYGTRKRDSQDSGVDFEQPTKARTRNLSRFDCDESISQLNSIIELSVLNKSDEMLDSTESRITNTTAQNTTLNNKKRQNGKRNIKLLDVVDDNDQKVDVDRSVVEDESMLQMKHNVCQTADEQSKVTEEKLSIKEPKIVEVSKDKRKGERTLSNEQCSEMQEPNSKVKNLRDDAVKKVHEDVQDNVHMQSINDKKLSAEFGLKDCSVKLCAASVAVETTTSSTATASQNPSSSTRDNYFPSPQSSTPQVFISPEGDMSGGSVSTGGRFLNMVKSAVGVLLPAVMRRTGSPSVVREVNGPSSTTNESDVALPANNMTPNNIAQTEQSSKVHSAKQSTGRVSKSRRSSSGKVLKGGPKLSLSKRRSSTVGYKARLVESRKSRSLSMNALHMTEQAVFEQKQAHIVTSALEDEVRASDGDIDGSDDEEIMDTPPKRVTRSKMRPCPRTVVTVQKKTHAEQAAPVLRVTRSKLRVNEKPQPLEDAEDDDTPTTRTLGFQAPKTPSTVIKAKPLGQKVQQMQKLLCENPSFGLGNSTQKPKLVSPASSSSSVRRKSSKRAHDDQPTNSDSPPKRFCTKQSFFSPAESGRRVQPFGSCQASKTSDVHSFLKKKPTTGTPVQNNVSSVITSFLQKNTPKILTREEIFERKRRELEEKNKKMNEMAQKRAELMQKRVEMQRRVREEQYQLVQKRRQEIERDVKKTSGNNVTNANTRLSEDNAPRMTTRLQIDDRSKVDQQEKQKLRDKRIADAEQRRKQEEEAKKQILLQQDREKQAQEELVRRRREHEEAERQQRMAEQRRQEEERRVRLEREKQLELQRQRQFEEQRLREEQEKQRAKEERERKERAEKEKQEIERAREKERIKQQEIERQKEMERIRIAEERVRQEAERRMREEQQKTQKAIEKHNSLQKQVSSTNVSQNTTSTTKKDLVVSLVDVSNAAGTKPAVNKSQAETTLNRTFSKEVTSESYEMTPVAKKVYKSSNLENYDIGDLNSEDSTDEEDKPRKRIPAWAEGTALKVALINQHCHPPNLVELFGTIDMPDLNELFVKKRPRFNKRTSSAVWEASILLPKSP